MGIISRVIKTSIKVGAAPIIIPVRLAQKLFPPPKKPPVPLYLTTKYSHTDKHDEVAVERSTDDHVDQK